MRALPFLIAGSLLMVAAARQGNLPAPLANDFAKLSAAKSLSVTYTAQIVGDAPLAYKLALSKPNLYRLTYPGGFVVSDGKTVTTYTADKNAYSQEPATDATLAAFLHRPEVVGWSAALAKNPEADVVLAKLSTPRNVKGNPTTQVDVALKGKTGDGTIFVDDKLGVTRGYDLRSGGKEYLVVASDLTVSPDALPDTQFAFVAPEGAKLVEAPKAGGLFAQVQDMMTASCMPCHSAQGRRAGVDMSSYDGIVATVTPGDASSSLLVKALRGDGVKKMPLGRPSLSEDQIHVVESWINAGAKKD